MFKLLCFGVFCYIIILNFPSTLDLVRKDITAYYLYIISEISFLIAYNVIRSEDDANITLSDDLWQVIPKCVFLPQSPNMVIRAQLPENRNVRLKILS